MPSCSWCPVVTDLMYVAPKHIRQHKKTNEKRKRTIYANNSTPLTLPRVQNIFTNEIGVVFGTLGQHPDPSQILLKVLLESGEETFWAKGITRKLEQDYDSPGARKKNTP